MSGSDILLDTNILLFFLEGNKEVRKFFFDYNPVISFVTELELLSSPQLSENDKSNIKLLLSEITVLNYSDKYKQTIIDIRSAKRLKLPDAIIAATAIISGMPLVSADRALNNIPKLATVFYNVSGNE